MSPFSLTRPLPEDAAQAVPRTGVPQGPTGSPETPAAAPAEGRHA
ncbi:hypothetical protein [Streptomyces cinereospinus]|uniref:Uncharacterized protein n=1 Tax=Streptomyces cinereospinus TaxID=285561 RepID=A0ABV5N9H0_9ACTN